MEPCPFQDWERSRGKPSCVSLRPSPAQYYDRVEIEESRNRKRGWEWSLEKVTDFCELPPFLWWLVSGGEGALCFPLTSNWENGASVRLLRQHDLWLLESGRQGLVGDPHLEQPKGGDYSQTTSPQTQQRWLLWEWLFLETMDKNPFDKYLLSSY